MKPGATRGNEFRPFCKQPNIAIRQLWPSNFINCHEYNNPPGSEVINNISNNISAHIKTCSLRYFIIKCIFHIEARRRGLCFCFCSLVLDRLMSGSSAINKVRSAGRQGSSGLTYDLHSQPKWTTSTFHNICRWTNITP